MVLTSYVASASLQLTLLLADPLNLPTWHKVLIVVILVICEHVFLPEEVYYCIAYV